MVCLYRRVQGQFVNVGLLLVRVSAGDHHRVCLAAAHGVDVDAFQRLDFLRGGRRLAALAKTLTIITCLLGLGRYSPYRYNIDTEGNRYVLIQSSCRIDTQIWWLPQKWNNYSGKKVFVFWKQNLWTFIITHLFNAKSCKNWVLKHLEQCSSKMTA